MVYNATMVEIRKIGAVVILILAARCAASITIVAQDDASDPVYNPGIYHNMNGGTGFGPFSTNSFPFGGNPNLTEGVTTSTLNGPGGPDIDTGGRAWGNNATPTGNTFLARRSLLADLQVGGTFSVDYDSGDVDGRETISFGQGANSICQFYFDGSLANYQFVDVLSSTTIDTSMLQTFGGVRLTLTRVTASTYSFQAVRLFDSFTYNFGPAPYDTSLITGIRTLNVSNFDGGNGGGHEMFINRMIATAPDVPEPGGWVMVVIGTMAGAARRRRVR